MYSLLFVFNKQVEPGKIGLKTDCIVFPEIFVKSRHAAVLSQASYESNSIVCFMTTWDVVFEKVKKIVKSHYQHRGMLQTE
jgi:hypothetical protein